MERRRGHTLKPMKMPSPVIISLCPARYTPVVHDQRWVKTGVWMRLFCLPREMLRFFDVPCCLGCDCAIFIISPGFLKPMEPSEDYCFACVCRVSTSGGKNKYVQKLNQGRDCEDSENLFEVSDLCAISLHDYFIVVASVSDCIYMSPGSLLSV